MNQSAMKKKYPRMLYDRESEVFSVEMRGEKSADSEISDNVVVDYDMKGKIVRLNFYNFSFDTFRENKRALREFARTQKSPLVIAR